MQAATHVREISVTQCPIWLLSCARRPVYVSMTLDLKTFSARRRGRLGDPTAGRPLSPEPR